MDPTPDPSQDEAPQRAPNTQGVRLPFLSPRLIGKRFDDHGIPLDVLKDLAALEELLFDVAKWKRIQAEQGRQRAPRGFRDGVRLELAAVQPGSAIASILLVLPPTSGLLFDSDQKHWFEQARDAIVLAVDAAQHGRPQRVLELIPEDALRHFKNHIGKHLRDGEAIGFPMPNGTDQAILDKESRQRLVFASSTQQYVTEEATLRGVVFEGDHSGRSFKLRLADGSIVGGSAEPDHWPTIAKAWTEYARERKVRIDGVVRRLRNNNLDRFETVEQVTILEPRDIDARLEELALLEDGWLDGHGKRPPAQGLRWLAAAFGEHYDPDLALPYLYPTESGGVQAEWPLREGEAELEIDLSTKHAQWFADFRDGREDQEASFDLASSESWKSINDRLREAGGLAE
ncbi:MAG: hypothetical protein KIT54_06130 [Phycisphaeraceae bacterium]|nr:hypothetical protein [Phycisphaeraceae bacterium]